MSAPRHTSPRFLASLLVASVALFFANGSLFAATRTISNAGGNWNAVGTWVEGAVPTSADDVVATGTSGNITINVAAACRSINLTNYTQTVTHNAGVTLSIGDATAGTGNNALVFPSSGWTYTLGNNTTSAISFVTTSATAQTVNFGGKTIGNVNFNGAGAVWVLTGSQSSTLNTNTLTAGTIRVNNASAFGSGTITIAGTVTLDNTSGSAITLANNNAQNWNSNFTFTGTNNLNMGTGAVAMNATRTLTINGGEFAVGGVISGATFGITKNGAGTLVLSGNNTFSGAVTLSAGTLRATTSTGALGTSTLALNGGTLELQNDTALNFARNTTVGAAATIVSNRATSGAGVTHTLGTLSIGNFTLNVNAGGNVASGTAGVTFGATTLSAATPIFDVGTGALLTLGAITGNFNFQKLDAGELTLGSASARSSGSCTVTGGTLRLGSTSALGTTATTLVMNGGTLDLATNTTINAYPTTVSAASTIVSNRATTGAGITHTLGTLSIGNFTININAGGNVTSGTAAVTFGATTLSAATPIFDVASGALLTLGAITGNFNFQKTDAGQLTLGSASTRSSGSCTITGGKLRLGSTSGLGTTGTTVVLNGGTLELGASTTVNAYPTTVSGNSTILSDRATAGAGVTHTLGTLSIGNATLDVSTGTNVTSGTGGVTFGATTLSASTPIIDVDATALVTLGALSGNFNFEKSGPGTLVMGSASARSSGSTTINAGTLRVGSTSAFGTTGTTLVLNGGRLDIAVSTSINAYPTTVTADSTVASGRATSGAGVTHTLGTLSIGVSTLTATLGTNAASGTAAVTFGATTLTGDPTFAVTNGAAAAQLTIGAVNDGGSVARTISKTSNGTLIFGSAATSLIDGTQINVVAGTAASNNATGVGALAAIDIASGAMFRAGANQTLGSIANSGTLSLQTFTVTVGGANNLNSTFPGATSGTGGLTKAGSGTLTLSGTNGHTGATTLSAGTLRATTVAGALGAGTLVLNGGTLELANDTGLSFNRNTTVGGSVSIVSDGLTPGVGVTHTLGTLSIGNFTLSLSSGSNVTSGTAGVTFGATTLSAATPVWDVGPDTVLTLGTLAGAFAMTKQNTGELRLQSASTRTGGATTLSDGRLRLGSTSALGTTGATMVLNGGTLELYTDTTMNAYPTTVSNEVTIVSNRATSGAGITHTLGTLSIGVSTMNVEVGGNVASGSQGVTFGATTLTGSPTFDVMSGVSPAIPLTLQIGAVNDGTTSKTITKRNTGTLTFGAAATSLVNGTIIEVAQGQVNTNNATGMGGLAVVNLTAGTTVQLGANQTVGSVNGDGNIVLQTFTLTIGAANNLTSSFTGTTSGTGGITKAGTATLTLTTSLGHTGTTTLTAGTLRAEAAGSLGAGALALNGGTLELASDSNANWGMNTTLGGNPTIRLDRLTSGPAVTHTLGTLSIGNRTLIVEPGANVSSGDAELEFGATTLTASTAIFDVNAGAVTTLGALSGNFNISKIDSGKLRLGSASARSGGSATVTAGTLRLEATSALGTTAATLVLNGGTLELGTDTTVNAHPTLVTAVSTVISDRATSGAGITHTLGTLSIGNFTLNVATGSNVTSGTAGVTFGATTLSAATPVFDVGTGALLTLGALSGNFNFSKIDDGTLRLASGSTRASGSCTVTGGTLDLSSTSGLGTTGATLVLNGGTLELGTDTTVNAYPTSLTASSTITSDRATSGAGVTHTLGTLSIGNFTLNVGVGANVTSGIAGVTFGATTLSASTPVLDVASGALLTLGAVTGNFNIEKAGAGQLTLGSASTRSSGSSTLTDGTLRLGAANALGTTGTTLVLNGGTLDLAVNTSVNAYPTTVGGNVTVSSNRSSNGAGVTHTLGTLSIGSFTLDIAAGTAVTSGSAGVTFGATTLTGDPTFNVTNGVGNVIATLGALADGSVARTISKSGTGILTLGTAASSIVSGTQVSVTGGTLNSNNATALGSGADIATGASGTFAVGANQTIGTVSNAGTLLLQGNTLTVSGNWANSGTFTHGNGVVTFTGATTHDLAGNSTFHTLRCTVPGATLQFAAGSTTTITNTIDFQDVSLLSGTNNSAWYLTFSGGIQTLVGVTVKDSDASNGNQLVPTSGTNLGNNVNWAFVRDILLSQNTLNLGALNPNSVTVLGTSIVVTNQGNETFTVELSISNPADWTATTGTPGADTFRLSVISRTSAPVSGDFGAEDVVTTSAVSSSSTVFARNADAASEKAYDILPGETRTLWFKIEMPQYSSTTTSQTITLVAHAIP